MPRPLTGGHRVINDRVYLRIRQEEWAVGPVSEWPQERIDAELARMVGQIRSGQTPTGPNAVADPVAAAVEKAIRPLALRLHPDDIETISRRVAELLQGHETARL